MRKLTISNDKLREMDDKTGGKTIDDGGYTYVVTMVTLSDRKTDDDGCIAIQSVVEVAAHASYLDAQDDAEILYGVSLERDFGCNMHLYYVTSRRVPEIDEDGAH